VKVTQWPRQVWCCKRCGSRITLTRPKTQACPFCGLLLRAVLDPASGEIRAPELVPPPVWETAPAGMCARHEQPAVATCERCGDFVCAGCARLMEGRSYCVGCVSLILKRHRRDLERKTGWWFLAIVGFALLLVAGEMLAAWVDHAIRWPGE